MRRASRDIVVDPGFLAEERRRAAERAARFAAPQAPPPLPVRSFAHPGGKIVTSDKLEKLQSFIDRVGEAAAGPRALELRDRLLREQQAGASAEQPSSPVSTTDTSDSERTERSSSRPRRRRASASLARRRGARPRSLLWTPWAHRTSVTFKLLALRRANRRLAARARRLRAKAEAGSLVL